MSTHDLGDSRRPTFKGFLKTRSWRQDPLPDVNQSGAARTTSITSIADIIPMIKSDSIMSLKDGRRRSIVDYGGPTARRISNAEVMAEAMAVNNPYVLPPISLNRPSSNELERRPSLTRRMSLTVDSPIQDFRSYQKNVTHPANALRVGTAEDDREVVTEFDVLCNEVLSVVGEVESSLEDLTNWKDEFLKQSVPSNVKLTLALLFARILRSKSDLHEPVFELIKQIKLYSRPWVDKRNAILELEKDYQRHTQVLDVAIRKLELMQIHTIQIKSQHRVALWERLTSRLFDYMPPDNPDNESVQFSKIDIFTLPVKTELANVNEEESDSSSDEDESERLSPAEFRQLVGSIKEYIAQDAPDKAKLKASIRQFERVLKTQHPGYKHRMSTILQRPFPTIARLNYLSFQTGTIVRQKLRKFPLPRAWSELDLRVFANDVPPRDNKDSRKKKRNLNDEGGLPLRKSNSSHTIYILGKKAKLRRHVTVPITIKENARMKKSLAAAANKMKSNRWRPFEEVSDDEDDEYNDEDDAESVVDASDAYLDRDLLGALKPQDLEDAIQRFYLENPGKKTAREGQIGDEEGLLSQLDSKKEFFSLQEVVELTLLHAQQVHVLQKFYEQKMDDFQEKLASMQGRHIKTIDEFNRNIQLQQERSQKALLDLSKKFNDQLEQAQANAPRTPRPSSRGTILQNHAPPLSNASPTSSYLDSSKTKKQEKPLSPPPKPITPARQRQKSLIKPEEIPERKPSIATATEFMERLRKFTDDALVKRESIRIQMINEEKLANEKKLGHTMIASQIIELDKDSKVVPGVFAADFMPAPGAPKKLRDSWGNKGLGPWGGRFKPDGAPRTDGTKLNILNLFDVAMHIEHKRSNSGEDGK